MEKLEENESRATAEPLRGERGGTSAHWHDARESILSNARTANIDIFKVGKKCTATQTHHVGRSVMQNRAQLDPPSARRTRAATLPSDEGMWKRDLHDPVTRNEWKPAGSCRPNQRPQQGCQTKCECALRTSNNECICRRPPRPATFLRG